MSDDAIERPGKILAVHLNYPSRAAQRGRVPAQPSYFLKPSTSVAASGSPLERPAGAELLAFEGEIALIIGTTARRVSPEDGWAHVSGVTAGNDFGIYDLRTADKNSNVRSKGGDGFTPLGPAVLPAAELDPAGLRVRTWVDGELVQDDTTATLLFPFGRLVADLSQLLTLEPGDVILTGTPAGSSVVSPGQTVEVEVDVPGGPTTGRLVTPIVEGTVPFGDFGSKPSVDDTQREEAWGSRAAAGLPAPFELTDDLRDRLLGVAVATLSVQLRQRGYDDVSIDGVAPNKTGDAAKFAGRARTLRYVPHRPDLFAEHGGGFNAQKRLFDTVNPGEVVVMEARGDATAGTVGDVLALRAQVRGAAAIVTDGAVRDADVVAALDIPTFSRGAHPSVLGRRHIPWETDVTISCGGATVQPGDVIVGDGDGAIVIPPALVTEVLEAAEAQEREEEFIARQVRDGASVDGLFPMNADWRARYEEESR
jgi:2-keto-4-pentenoate hydratase/2-oxohepta-3-ene-1,7-dioic acid hydratase in catechol pathway/regulator of RNase E activity RraA